MQDSCRAHLPRRAVPTFECGGKASAFTHSTQPLEWLERSELRIRNVLPLQKYLEAFAKAFRVDESFQLQPGAEARSFVHAGFVEIFEVISLS